MSYAPSQFGFPYTVDPGAIRSGDAKNVSTNGAIYARVRDSGPISKIGLQVVVSSGNLSVAVYRNSGNGRTAVPGTRAATSGAVACPSIGYAEISLGASLFVFEGDWFGISADNSTATFICVFATAADSNLGLGRQFRQATAHPLPTTPSSLVARVGDAIVLVGVQ